MTETELSGTGSFDAVGFALGLRVRDVVHHPDRERDGERAVWFYAHTDGGWSTTVRASPGSG
ncbi:hypothetical protein ACFXKG_08535 [Streptomyces sp. NPDC059255]|uniref:hypothetical protein n=1 Tax=Streptomyces sp. NPDC059255 TaxID=3346793 RepID=UPI0036A03F3E